MEIATASRAAFQYSHFDGTDSLAFSLRHGGRVRLRLGRIFGDFGGVGLGLRDWNLFGRSFGFRFHGFYRRDFVLIRHYARVYQARFMSVPENTGFSNKTKAISEIIRGFIIRNELHNVGFHPRDVLCITASLTPGDETQRSGLISAGRAVRELVMSEKSMVILDGNEAAASVAYRLTEVVAIYPITPSSPIADGPRGA